MDEERTSPDEPQDSRSLPLDAAPAAQDAATAPDTAPGQDEVPAPAAVPAPDTASVQGKPKSGFFRGFAEFILAFAVMAAVLFGVRTFVIEAYNIPSGSMIPTIQRGDNLYAEKISIKAADFVPVVGQVYTFISPSDPTETLIKRVIAVEGQTIDLIDGQVYIDGVALDEPYVHGQLTYSMSGRNGISYPYTIPDGCFWAMGDNRGNSSDSRVFGPVEISSITGHAVLTFWPALRSSDTVTVDFGVFSFEFPAFELNVGPLDYT